MLLVLPLGTLYLVLFATDRLFSVPSTVPRALTGLPAALTPTAAVPAEPLVHPDRAVPGPGLRSCRQLQTAVPGLRMAGPASREIPGAAIPTGPPLAGPPRCSHSPSPRWDPWAARAPEGRGAAGGPRSPLPPAARPEQRSTDGGTALHRPQALRGHGNTAPSLSEQLLLPQRMEHS